jgi:hypothetical protein
MSSLLVLLDDFGEMSLSWDDRLLVARVVVVVILGDDEKAEHLSRMRADETVTTENFMILFLWMIRSRI